MTFNNRPRYEHDCEKCTYLGTYDGYDLYYCPHGAPGFKIPTVLARRGNDPEQYISGMAAAKQNPLHSSFCMPALRVAYLIAKDLALID
jgi:hypothetical protein